MCSCCCCRRSGAAWRRPSRKRGRSHWPLLSPIGLFWPHPTGSTSDIITGCQALQLTFSVPPIMRNFEFMQRETFLAALFVRPCSTLPSAIFTSRPLPLGLGLPALSAFHFPGRISSTLSPSRLMSACCVCTFAQNTVRSTGHFEFWVRKIACRLA